MKKISIIVFVAAMIVPIAIYRILGYENNKVEILKEINIINDLNNIIYSLDKVEVVDDNLNIEGWVVEKGIDNTYFNKSFVLISDKNDYFKINTVMKARPDVTTFFNDNNSYDKSGLASIIELDNINVGKYTVGILLKDIDSNEKIVVTDKSIEIK